MSSMYETKICSHAAIKLCNPWFEESIKGISGCFKNKFYGIISHQCFQMSTCLTCNQSCIYCWAPTERKGTIQKWEDSNYIVVAALNMYRRLVSQYRFLSLVDQKRVEEAMQPKHVAISLYGESTLYPYLPELINEFQNKDLTVFLTTNGTNPEMVEKITPTQLILSLNAPDEETYNKICRPSSKKLWRKINETLEIFNSVNVRTVIRIVLMKGLNLKKIEGFTKLIEKGNPHFIEVKSYEHIGAARKRLHQSMRPSYVDIRCFAEKLSLMTNYKIINEEKKQQVILMSRGSLDPLLKKN